MAWTVGLIVIIIAVILAILFLNRFYKKATREVALVRTGAGGEKVILDGGCLALPILHKVAEVNMKTSKLEIERAGEKSMITKDRLRVDAGAEFYVRVRPTAEGVATAAQALAGKSFRAAELADTLEGKLVDAMLAVAAGYTMDALQDNRGKYAAEVSEALADNLAQNGLDLESVSLTRLDQTPFHALDENNAFNAVGMRRLAEIIATNKKERAAIEADADVSVRQSQLDATKRRLIIQQEEEEAEISQQQEIENKRASSQADIAERQAASEERREQARIKREQQVRSTEIERDRTLRRLELEASLGTETAKHEKEIQLAEKRIEEARAHAKAETARAEEIAAKEAVETAREQAVAERIKQVALIKAAEQAGVDDTRVKSEAETILAKADAEARSISVRAKATKEEMLARAAGTAALAEADNALSCDVIKMKTDLAKLKTLPDLVGQMMKPTEKIDSIRINHLTGFGGAAGGTGDANGSGDKAIVNQAVDGILSMALQLPAVKKLGEEIGINIGDGLRGLSDGPTIDDESDQGISDESDTEEKN
ncbi:MAG: flotillin family protein [Geminicoccaceae bacterium]